MTIDIVNAQNEKVGSLDLSDEVFGGRVKADLIWEQVVHENASPAARHARDQDPRPRERQRQKPWRQKGTGRARVGEIREPAVAQGRHRVRAAAARLQLRAAEEGRARRAALGAHGAAA